MYDTARLLLFRLDPERAHDLVLGGLHWAGRSALALRLLERSYGAHDPRLAVEAFGLRFPSPIGLAAGLDKDGVAVRALAAVGFGHLELGTVTARAQPGNPRPRLFRLVEDQAIINRMGFNNRGADALVDRLARVRRNGGVGVPLGVNVGKSRVVPLEEAVLDYDRALRAAWPVADYLALNVSSPNTPGLRRLQEREPLEALLGLARHLKDELGPRPVLLKIAPDLTRDQLLELAEVAERFGVDGLIATNTTVAREGLRSPRAGEAGGLSGRPLAATSLAVLRTLKEATRLPLVSVGGVWSGADVIERLEAGATLVQVYTAFIYRGPGLLASAHREVLGALERRGLDRVGALTAGVGARGRPDAPSGR
ncbi:MAG: quinone-dependent dihydroorotate dehydrogenase [Deinococcales bacterium]